MLPAELKTGTVESYRIKKETLFFIGVFCAFLSAIARLAEFFPLSFVLLPLIFLFVNLNAYRFLVLLLAGYLLFFPGGSPGTAMLGVYTTDGLSFVFVFLFLLSLARTNEPIGIPVSSTLWLVYLFVAYAVVLSFRSFPTTRPFDVAFDLKNISYLLFVPLLLMLDGRSREPKKFFLLLGTFVLFCSIHSLEVIASFLLSRDRVITWNEVFISDAVVISALMLRFPLRPGTKWLLRTALVLSTLGLLFTQTRGLWLSTLVALSLYYAREFFRGNNLQIGRLLKSAAIGVGAFLAANVLFIGVMGIPIHVFIRRRFGDNGINEFIDPFASVGYRIHEALAIWTQRTIFGHGTGSTLHLYFTQLNEARFMDWWAIHSGYFELLHKFGFVGLTIALWMFGAYYFLGRRLAKSSSKVVATFGGIIATVIVNHAVVSIASGAFFRHVVIIWIPLFFIAERLRPRLRTKGSSRDAPSDSPPAARPLEE